MTNPGTFCENCGAALRASSRFCEGCGQPVGAGGGAAAPRAPVAATLQCGTCGNGDQVVAASAYKAANDPEVKGDDDRVSPDMVESFLEAPSKPVASGILGWALAPFIPLVLFFIYWFAPIHRGFKFFLFGFTVMFWVSALNPKMNAAQIYAFIGMLHFLFYWVALFMGRDAAKVKLLTDEIPAYNTGIARWQHVQYCTRCQKVWLDNASTAPVDLVDVETLLKG
jgi:hypothetical protein